MKKAAAFMLFALAITGCATTSANMYSEPPEERSAILETSVMQRESLTEWKRITIIAIDDKFLDVSAWDGLPKEKLKIKTGKRQIVISATVNPGSMTQLFGATLPLSFDASDEIEYRPAGESSGTKFHVWIEQKDGGRVSDAVSGHLSPAPIPSAPIIFMPIK